MAKENRMSLAARLKFAEFVHSVKDYEPPVKEELEKSVEDGTKCGKCGCGVRALIEEVQESRAFANDLDMLVDITCRDAACAWQARQWRPWVRTRRKEL
jgi:bacterioferritin-associated ferredoxin